MPKTRKKAAKRPARPSAARAEAGKDGDNLPTELESVLEEVSASGGKRRTTRWSQVQCPYCGESFEIHVEVSGEEDESIQEDCQICCRPIEFSIHVEDNEVQISANRG